MTRTPSAPPATRTPPSVTFVMVGIAVLAFGLSAVLPVHGAVRDPFPDPKPATRAAALALVAGEASAPLGCLTPQIQGVAKSRLGANPAVQRAMALLGQRPHPGVERTALAADGTVVAYTEEPSAFDRVAPVDVDRDGTPDLVQRVVEGLNLGRSLLVEQLRLPAPTGLDVVLLELGAELDGYLVSQEDGRTIVLDGSRRDHEDAVRSAAIHQYAHAVAEAAGPHMSREWGEALATWATFELQGGTDGITAAVFSDRIERLDAGLVSRDLELAPGNAIWLAFLNEAYGPAAVSVTVQELAAGAPTAVALDRALGRVSDDDLAAAFREFHLWTVLTGPRADRHHFSFAEQLSGPRFASSIEGLPALSVQVEPAIAPWGATQVHVIPGHREGGLGIRFEGEVEAGWEADLVLVDVTGTMRRLAIDLTGESWGESTVPLEGVAEALLLIRSVGSVDGGAHRYTYAAHHERGYPFEVASIDARNLETGVDLQWETASEQQVIGFNILRVREDGGRDVVVNPVWIPALGDRDLATSYQFLDRTAVAGVSYLYRIQAITVDGLTSLSEPLVVRRPDAR